MAGVAVEVGAATYTVEQGAAYKPETKAHILV
jgi:hypothetical protein